MMREVSDTVLRLSVDICLIVSDLKNLSNYYFTESLALSLLIEASTMKALSYLSMKRCV